MEQSGVIEIYGALKCLHILTAALLHHTFQQCGLLAVVFICTVYMHSYLHILLVFS